MRGYAIAILFFFNSATFVNLIHLLIGILEKKSPFPIAMMQWLCNFMSICVSVQQCIELDFRRSSLMNVKTRIQQVMRNMNWWHTVTMAAAHSFGQCLSDWFLRLQLSVRRNGVAHTDLSDSRPSKQSGSVFISGALDWCICTQIRRSQILRSSSNLAHCSAHRDPDPRS